MASFEIGAGIEQTVVVEDEYAIKFLGPNGARVLSTPRMIGLMERACRDLMLPMLDPGQDTVGTHVNVYHRKAAPMGSTVIFTAQLTAVERRRAQFNVKAMMGTVVIGEGTHERAIIEVSSFGRG
ncbi:MAG: Thioesterase superfamily [Bryobacterales bacterium]|jgi:fluoroacetyl-CoA thioesterase|nr:Thioesterase superfamily [Bryobacterales bacterium]